MFAHPNLLLVLLSSSLALSFVGGPQPLNLPVAGGPQKAAGPAPVPALGGAPIFELDGDAMDDLASPTLEDWSGLFAGGAETGGGSIAYTGVVPDPGQNTIFDGGKKDYQDLDRWSWKNNGGFPDKNDITNAYAAAYQDERGDLIIYYGADRYANDGDAFLGFWFFKDRVTINPNGTFGGQHQVGDVLVLLNYLQGNVGPEVQVIEWNPAEEDIARNLHLLYSGQGALCGDVPPGMVCATTNLVDRPSPWAYTPKSGAAGTFPEESFFEGGINLSQILGEPACFSSFMAETRSSTSLSATLKDFVLGDFPVCGIEVSKTCDVIGYTPGFTDFIVSFDATVTNTGAGTFGAGSLLTVTDDAGTPGDDTDDVVIQQVLQQALGPGETIEVSGQFPSDSNPPVNVINAVIDTQDASVAADPFSIECSPLNLDPALDLTMMCSVSLETVGGVLVSRVDYTGTVSNTGTLPLYVTVTDGDGGTVLATTLMDPGDSSPVSASIYPAAANGGATDPCDVMFSHTFTAIGDNPLLPVPITQMKTGNCPLCPCQ